MSLVDEMRGPCAYCQELDEVGATFSRCPVCGERVLRDEADVLDEPVRRDVKASADWPGFEKRGNGRTT